MDHAVALVEAYLQINGYFTVAEYPVIESFGKDHYGVATDLDILAFRFPGAGRLVADHGSKKYFAPDPELGIEGAKADMLIGAVKKDLAELNSNARYPDVLRTVLARFGCCPLDDVNASVQQLIRTGHSTTHSGYRVRLMTFGSSGEESRHNGCGILTLGHIINFVEDYFDQDWGMISHAQFKHHALGLFMTLDKARREII